MLYQIGEEFINLDNVKVVDFSTPIPRARFVGEASWHPLRGTQHEFDRMRERLQQMASIYLELDTKPKKTTKKTEA